MNETPVPTKEFRTSIAIVCKFQQIRFRDMKADGQSCWFDDLEFLDNVPPFKKGQLFKWFSIAFNREPMMCKTEDWLGRKSEPIKFESTMFRAFKAIVEFSNREREKGVVSLGSAEFQCGTIDT